MANLPSESAPVGLSTWWRDRSFTKRQGQMHALLFSAIGVFATFALCVVLSA